MERLGRCNFSPTFLKSVKDLVKRLRSMDAVKLQLDFKYFTILEQD